MRDRAHPHAGGEREAIVHPLRRDRRVVMLAIVAWSCS
jgi:hypothetical protein